jgi:ABC-type branched-subunit amino acid transport system substrate-binding protein
MVKVVAEAVAGLPVTLINATAPEESVRTACYPNMLHAGPSLRMTMDSYVQYLRAMNWMKVLVLVGEDPSDQGLADAFVTSAERMRLEVTGTRTFTCACHCPTDSAGAGFRSSLECSGWNTTYHHPRQHCCDQSTGR